MEFRLFYRGQLKANGGTRHKQEIRRFFHRQMRDLWNQPPLIDSGKRFLDQSNELSILEHVGKFRFAPLVSSHIGFMAELDILLLRPGEPGRIVNHGGDIDNRLKTLWDAFRVPQEQEIKNDAPAADEDPFYCLFEDDALVTSVRVSTDRLLDPVDEKEVLLVIHMIVKAAKPMIATLGLV